MSESQRLTEKSWTWRRYQCLKCPATVPYNQRKAHAARHVNQEDRVGDWYSGLFKEIKE